MFDVRERAGQLEWVAEITGTKSSLIKEVRELGGSETVCSNVVIAVVL